MTIGARLEYFHVLAAAAFIAGMVGRTLTFHQARRATALVAVGALLHASDTFDRALVRPGGLILLLFGLLAAWAEGWPILGFLQGSDVNWVLAALVLTVGGVAMAIAILLPKARRRAALLAEAEAQGQITPALCAALDDRTVMNTRRVELVVVAFIVFLMVVKPF